MLMTDVGEISDIEKNKLLMILLTTYLTFTIIKSPTSFLLYNVVIILIMSQISTDGRSK